MNLSYIPNLKKVQIGLACLAVSMTASFAQLESTINLAGKVFSSSTFEGALVNDSPFYHYEITGGLTIKINGVTHTATMEGVAASTGGKLKLKGIRSKEQATSKLIDASVDLAIPGGEITIPYVLKYNLVPVDGKYKPVLSINGVLPTGISVRFNSETKVIVRTAPVIQVARGGYIIDETAGILKIKVIRKGNQKIPTSVQYETVGGSATAGTDYTPVSGLLKFGAGKLSGYIEIPINDNATPDRIREFGLVLTSTPNGTVLGSKSTSRIRIRADVN